MLSSVEGNAEDFKAVVGQHNRDRAEVTRRTHSIEKIIVHEDYDITTTNNDIALVKLSTPVRYNRNVSPICLPQKDMSEDALCVATGWGNTEGK